MIGSCAWRAKWPHFVSHFAMFRVIACGHRHRDTCKCSPTIWMQFKRVGVHRIFVHVACMCTFRVFAFTLSQLLRKQLKSGVPLSEWDLRVCMHAKYTIVRVVAVCVFDMFSPYAIKTCTGPRCPKTPFRHVGGHTEHRAAYRARSDCKCGR